MLFDMVPDYAVDIPLIWQYIGEILGKISSTLQETCRHSFAVGAFIGAPSSEYVPPQIDCTIRSSRQSDLPLSIHHSIRCRILGRHNALPHTSSHHFLSSVQSKARLQSYWQQSGLSLNDVLQTDQLDSSFEREYEWLTDASDAEMMLQSKENHSPHSDPHLVKLFKSVNDANTTVTDSEILNHIRDVRIDVAMLPSHLSSFSSN